MAEHQRIRIAVPSSPPGHWTQSASVVVRLSAVYLAILRALFVAFRWPMLLVPGIAIASIFAWYSAHLAHRYL